MNTIRPYDPDKVVTLPPDYRRNIIPLYPVRPGDQHWLDEEGRKHRTGPGWWWCYHYGTNEYFTINQLDDYAAKQMCIDHGWQFEGAATCKS